jgi:hypothetical protein
MPQDKILQMLSCECISNYIQYIYEIADEIEFASDIKKSTFYTLSSPTQKPKKVNIDEKSQFTLNQLANDFTEKLIGQFKDLTDTNSQSINQPTHIDYMLKKFCLEYLKGLKDGENSFSRKLKVSQNKIFATANFCLYLIIKFVDKHNSNSLFLTHLDFLQTNESHQDFFISRILAYCDENGLDDDLDFLTMLTHWLSSIYKYILKFINENLSDDLLNLCINNEILFYISQMDCFTRVNLIQNDGPIDSVVHLTNQLITKLLKSSWIYIIDIITGFLLNSDLKPIEMILFFDIEKSQSFDNNLLTHVSLSLFSCKSCLESLFQLIKLITRLSNSFYHELIQIFSLLESNYFKEYFNLGKENTFTSDNKININKLILIDFVAYVSTELLYNSKISPTSMYTSTLWKILVETYFLSLALQSNIDHSLACDFDSFSDDKQININKLLIQKNESLRFKSVYSNLNEIATENLPKSKSNEFNTTELNYNRQFLQKQRLIVFRTLFLYLNKNSSSDSVSISSLNKNNIIECLASNMNENLVYRQFSVLDSNCSITENAFLKTEALYFIWRFCLHSCEISKRMLFEVHLKNQHEYFTFNNLIIDKIDEVLVKLIMKCFSTDLIKRPDQEIFTSTFLSPMTKTQFHSFSTLSVFANEIWINVFTDYFNKVFSKCGSSQKQKSHLKEEEKNKKSCKNSHSRKKVGETLNLLMKNSRLKLSKLKIDSENRKANQKKTGRENFVIELSICKKIICLIQKMFEIYNLNHTNIFYLKLISTDFKPQEDCTPNISRSSISSTPSLNENNSIYNDLIEKLENSTLR